MKRLGEEVELGSSARLRGQGDHRASGMQEGEGIAVSDLTGKSPRRTSAVPAAPQSPSPDTTEQKLSPAPPSLLWKCQGTNPVHMFLPESQGCTRKHSDVTGSERRSV